MTNQRAMQFRRIYGIALSVMLAIAGLCLMAACYNIYHTGDGTFSREIVAAAFGEIAIPVYLCLAMVVVGFVLDWLLPAGKEKVNIIKNYNLVLERLHSKTDLTLCDTALQAQVAKEQKSWKLHKRISLILLVLGSLVFLYYGANGENFHQREITDSLIQAMYLLIPCMAVPFGYGVFAAHHRRNSMLREIQLLQQAGANRSPAPAAAVRSGKAVSVVRWVLLFVAVVILVYGYFAGGTADVLTKAINICTECVGLG